MEALFAIALHTSGADYLKAEAGLLAGGAPAVAALQGHLQDKSPLARLLARMILHWATGKSPNNDYVLKAIDASQAKAASSPQGKPSPSGITYMLGNKYGDSVADILAVHLIKESGWPFWKDVAVLRYLGEHNPANVAAALARYVVQSRALDLHNIALEILATVPDAERREAILDEQTRLTVHSESLPKDVAALL